MRTDPTRDNSGMRPANGGKDEWQTSGGQDGRSPQSKRRPGIADRFADLLRPLSEAQRRGLIARLSVGYYEGWRPSRAEIADLVALELGLLTVDECLQRERLRKAGSEPVEITESALSTHRATKRPAATTRRHTTASTVDRAWRCPIAPSMHGGPCNAGALG